MTCGWKAGGSRRRDEVAQRSPDQWETWDGSSRQGGESHENLTLELQGVNSAWDERCEKEGKEQGRMVLN